MDILGLSIKEVKEINITEVPFMVHYCWNAYNHRRVDLPFKDGKGGSKEGTFGIDWTPLNPVSRRLAREAKTKRVIPKKFLEGIPNS